MSVPMLPRVASNPALSGIGFPPAPMLPRSNSAPSLPGSMPLSPRMMPGAPMSGSFMGPPPNFPSGMSFPGAPPSGPLMGGSRPGELIIEVSRLLDMPMQTKLLSGDLKQYRVRVFDEENYEVGSTRELAGLIENVNPGPEVDTETIRIGPEGVIRMQTGSPTVFLQVEYAGGFVGNSRIGRCRIFRGDPRSSQVWKYELSDKRGNGVGCGIELKVVEAGAPLVPTSMGFGAVQTMPPGSFAPSGMLASAEMNSFKEPSFNTMPFDVVASNKGAPFGFEKGKGFPKGYGKGFEKGKGSFTEGMLPGKGKDKGKGKGKFEGPSWQTMPPLEDLQHFDHPKVDSAIINDKDLTELMNNLIDSNGFRDPTGGRTVFDVFKEDGLLFVTKNNKEPLRFERGQQPPYDLSPLFLPGPQQPSFHTMPPMGAMGPPNSMGTMAPGGMPPGMLPPTAGSLAPPQRGDAPVVAVIELDKITGLEAPQDGQNREVIVTLHHKDGREIDKKGPFPTERGGNFRTVLCNGAILTGRCSMEDLAKGGLEVFVRANYRKSGMMSSFMGSGLEAIGDTFPIMVTWKPEPAKDEELWSTNGHAVGGVFCAHRLARETDVRSMTQMQTQARSGKMSQSGSRNPSPVPKKSPAEEKAEAAALALEAQNRAFLQRIKIADPNTYTDDNKLQWTNEKGYREWKDLDSLFITMGPNYVAQSNEIGPNVCRVYEDDTSIWRELMQKDPTSPEALDFGGKDTPGQDRETKLKLIKTVYPGDPEKIQSTLRPLICRDREDIKYDNKELLSGQQTPPKQQPIPVKVTIKNAIRLRNKEAFQLGSVKPKVIVEVPGKPQSRLETRTALDAKSPEWNQILDVFGWQRGDDLKFTVAEAGWLGFDDHMGEFRLKTGDFYPEPFRGEVPLTNSGRKGNQSRGPEQAKLAVEVRVMAAGHSNKSWPPATPMYAPVQNLNNADQETQRLANWDPVQCAKLPFADVNPNYQINEDIWGAMADSKATTELLRPKPPGWKPVRVKDSCLMA